MSVEFLKSFGVKGEKQVYLIFADHPIHKARMIKSDVDSLDGRLKLFELTPYSAHLHLDETVWGHLKPEGLRS